MDFRSVSALTSYIKQLLEGDEVLKNVQFNGEISNLKYHQSGIMYLTLKDEKASIKAVVFATYARKFKVRFEDGMKVNVSGYISLYEAAGTYQIYITDMQPMGIGSLYMQFEQLKKKLYGEGLFAEDHKKPIPKYPLRIGVISAPQGAAIRDIMTTVQRRWPIAELILIPSLVQGKEAAGAIVQALDKADKMNFDVLLLSRGGGSIEDLWCFNEEIVARKIYSMKTPIISAIGHEIDVTIADYVSDRRAPTPTGAAEIATPNQEEIKQQLRQYDQRITQMFFKNFQHRFSDLQHYRNITYFKQPELLYANKRLQTDSLYNRMMIAKDRMLFMTRTRFGNYQKGMEKAFDLQMNLRKQRISSLIGKIDAMDPYRVMKRGYALIEKDHQVVDSVKAIELQDQLSICFHDGSVLTRVEQKEETK